MKNLSIEKASDLIPYPILFFDGACGLCHCFVDFLFFLDKRERFRVAPLQGQTAARLLPPSLLQSLNTLVILREDGVRLTRSDAVLFLLWTVGGFAKLLAVIGYAFPRRVRDFFYEFIARRRFFFFGKRSCRVPTESEKNKFLE